MKTLFLLPLFILSSLVMEDDYSSSTFNSQQEFDVCVQLVNNQGDPTSSNDIYGYAATNLITGEIVYPDRYYDDCFYGLEQGTYRFDSYQGYFCGTSSQTVTLSSALENEDGIIEVQLELWCE